MPSTCGIPGCLQPDSSGNAETLTVLSLSTFAVSLLATRYMETRQMKFTIGKTAVDMDFAEKADHSAVADRLLANPSVIAEIEKHADGFYFRAWERDGDIDQSTIDRVIGKALDDGIDAAVDYMIENDFDKNPSDYFHHCDGRSSTTRLLEGFFTAYEEENGIEPDSVEAEMFREVVMEQAIELIEARMSETDKSVPADFFGSRDEVKVVFVQGYGKYGQGLDDLYTDHLDNVSQAATVIPDHNLMLQFKLMNVSPVEFVEYYKTKRGEDLTNPVFSDGVSDYTRRQYLDNAKAWRFACATFMGQDTLDFDLPDWLARPAVAAEMAEIVRSCRDLDTPSPVSLDALETVLDNSTYGGVGTWYGRISAKEVMQGGFEKSFVATGGQIGVHDFINGSGYLSDVEDAVVIDLTSGRLFQEDRFGYGPESVYGFTRRALDGSTKPVEVSDWVRPSEGSWRSVKSSADGLYAEVTLVGGVSGNEHNGLYEVSTKNAFNVTTGPFDGYEVSGTLNDAKEAFEDFLEEVPAIAETSVSPSP